MKTLILSLVLLLPVHSQDLETNPPKFNPNETNEIPADPRARQGVSDKALIPGVINASEVFSEDVDKSLTEALREKDKQALRDLKAVYEKAIADKNLTALEPYLAKDFTAVMITADEVNDYDGIKAYWTKVEEFIGEDGTYTVTVEPDDTIFDGNIAIAKGIAKEHVVRGGKDIDLTSKWTAIARKEGDTWKLVRIQASIDPVKNPIIDALNKGKLWITGAVAAIAGLILGWLGTRTLVRRPHPNGRNPAD